jgi:hypothetical protein
MAQGQGFYNLGDANSDGWCNWGDVYELSDWLDGLMVPDLCPGGGDANGNGQMNGIDLAYLVSFLRGNGPPPLGACPSPVAARYRANQLDYREIAKLVEPGKTVISDASDALWWYADRPSVWIPVRYADFKTLTNSHSIRYLYLADPVAYMEKLSEDDVIDFIFSVEIVAEYSGAGKLYIIKNVELPLIDLPI